MGGLSGSYLKQNSEIVIENSRQALLKCQESQGLQRVYYYVVLKFGEKYSHPYRIKIKEFDIYYQKIVANK